MRRVKKVFATVFSVALVGAFMVPTGALASNGMMRDVNTNYENFGTIYITNPNAVSTSDMDDYYYDEYRIACDKLSPWTQEAEDKLYQEYENKCQAYEKSVSQLVYSGYSAEAHRAYVNKQRKDEGDPEYTAAEFAENYKYVIQRNTAQAVSGVSYNVASNTLTLKNYKSTSILYIYNGGNDFKLNLAGANELGGIYVDDDYQLNAKGERVNTRATWGAGLTITGSGTLNVNKNKNSNSPIMIQTRNTAAALNVAKTATLNLYSDGDSPVVEIYGTNVASAKNAMKFNGITDGAKVSWAHSDVAYPLYKRAYASDARDAAEGTYAIDSNGGDTGYTLLCTDNKHVARVVLSHKNASTNKYVIDKWEIGDVTAGPTPNAEGGYDTDYDWNGVYVNDNGSKPAGYNLTQVGTMPAGYSYAIADTSFTQYAKTAVVGKQTYTLKNTSEAYFTKAKNAKKVTVPASIKVNGKKFKVTGITAKAFAKAKKAKTVTIKTKLLTKKSVKNAFKKSKVKTVKVPAKVKKAYKKFMVKKVVGAKVTVK